MIRIAICDDQKEMTDRLEEMVSRYFAQEAVNVRIDTYQDSKAFWYELDEDTVYHLVLLDIEMPCLSGMDLAKELREKLPEALLFFISSYEKYVYDSFKYRPFRFIPKNQIEERLEPALADALRDMQYGEGQYYVAETGRDLMKIPYKSIVYIWREGKNAEFSLKNGSIVSVRKTLKQVYEKLPPEEFIWLDRGICGLSQIDRIEKNEAVLTDGSRVKVAKGKLYELKDKIRTYWLKREA